MVQNYGWVLTLLWIVCGVCHGAPIGNSEIENEFETENKAFERSEASRKTQIPQHHGSYPDVSAYNPAQPHTTTKKSDMPEKGQIKFMKTLLGKVKTLLHGSEDTKKEKSQKKKIPLATIPEKIRAVTSDNQNLYGVLGSPSENEDEKSVNVISIPLKALKKITNSEPLENNLQRVKEPGDLEHLPKNTQVLLRPVSVRLASNMGGENKGLTSLMPVVLQNQAPSLQPLRSYRTNFLPDGPDADPYDTTRLPFMIERHGDISRYNKGNEEGLYRDIGHIPGEISYHHDPTEDHAITGQASLRHKNPVRYHHSREDDYDDDDGQDDDQDDDDDYGEDDDDDDDEDDSDGNFEYSNSPRMRAEERQIAATRKRLYDMLPGNDPTYTSENRGLGLPMRPPGMMQVPEAFLGNPMVRPGVGFNQRNLMPSVGAAMAGEHADNSNDRSVFMFGGQGTKQVYGDSDVKEDSMRTSPMKVNSGGFSLGGSNAQAMSPNEVSYMLQKQPGLEQLSQKNKIFRPDYSNHKTAGVLLKVNGRPVGDSREFRDHIVNGVVFKGKEKVFKSKGPMDVKVSKATDGVHSKVVDITSADKVNVLEAKSKIGKPF